VFGNVPSPCAMIWCSISDSRGAGETLKFSVLQEGVV
jgi:hypothetical protein